eukprot:COSAG06_NODE_70573_length_191_cov_31.130435_1_plen_50_part_10
MIKTLWLLVPRNYLYLETDILKQGDRFSTFEVDMTNPDSVREFWNNIPER